MRLFKVTVAENETLSSLVHHPFKAADEFGLSIYRKKIVSLAHHSIPSNNPQATSDG